MQTLSKTLDEADYAFLQDEVSRVGHARNIFNGCHRYDHEHRTWEYSICLASLGPREAIKGKRILDVGGGDSLLGGILAWNGANVTIVDLSDYSNHTDEMNRRAQQCPSVTPGGSVCFKQHNIIDESLGLFDAVFCVSVIEHGGGDPLFSALLKSVVPGGTLVLTTDFHPSSEAKLAGHVQTYNADTLNRWAAADRFVSPGGTDYSDHGTPIFGMYTFASLRLVSQ
jgi:2-polyprenyl-3-methyl-5-hydroxy-6-metoxy-1,4-benzoquinol methylase